MQGHVLVEFGAFVGYTAVRLAGRACNKSSAISLEVVPAHCTVSRRVLALACAPPCAEVWIGQARDLEPRVLECFGVRSLTFAFMDHRGTRFHSELAQLSSLSLPSPIVVFVADNVLKPGAPILAWQSIPVPMPGCCRIASFLKAWSLAEYMADR